MAVAQATWRGGSKNAHIQANSRGSSLKNPKYRVAVIVVGYNSRVYLEDCLKALSQVTGREDEIILVDNNSSDGTKEYVSDKFPHVKLILNRRNLGFSEANNLAAKQAIDDGYRYLFFINPDTVIDSECLTRLLEAVDDQTILQPLILLYEKKKTNQINTTGNVLHYLGFSYVGNYRKDFRQVELKQDIALCSGAAMFIPVAIVDKIGLFDEDFFTYHEDVDLSWRARLAGYKIKLLPTALVWHKYHFSRNPKKMYYTELNRWRFIGQNYQLHTILLLLPVFLITELMMHAYALLSGWLGSKLASDWSLIKDLRRIVKKRHQRSHLLSDGEMKPYFTLALEFAEIRVPALGIFNSFLRGYWALVKK